MIDCDEREGGKKRFDGQRPLFLTPPRPENPKTKLLQVRHLLSVETDEQRRARRAAEAARSAQREPLEFEH